jgi:L-lactate dehydrogenase complex protein LldG
LCGACKEACPVDIDLPKLLLRVRAGGEQIETRHTPQGVPKALEVALRMFTWIAVHPGRFAAGQKLAGIGSRVLAPFSSWLRLPAFTGWGYSKDFPRPAARSFHERWQSREQTGKGKISSFYPAAPGTSPKKGNEPDNNPLPADFPKQVPVSSPAHTPQLLLERFTTELTALGGQVTVCQREELAGSILELLRRKAINRIQAWDAARLPSDLLPALQAAGIQVDHDPDPTISAGLTGALAAVAETGTLVLPGGPGRPLTASLLPEIHIAVVPVEALRLGLREILILPEVRQTSASALVTGPSRTADIEMALTIGVHGPGELQVFFI